MADTSADNATANIRILFYGDTGVLVEFDQASTKPTIDSVTALNNRVLAIKMHGIISTTPSYASLLIAFDPLLTSGQKLASVITELLQDLHPLQATSEPEGKSIAWQLPTHFWEKDHEDALALQDELGLSWCEIIGDFCAISYRVNAIGFLPGFTYLGGLPAQLACRRLDTPKIRCPPPQWQLPENKQGFIQWTRPVDGACWAVCLFLFLIASSHRPPYSHPTIESPSFPYPNRALPS